MKSTIAGSILTSLVIAALLLISCGPRAATPTPEPGAAPAPSPGALTPTPTPAAPVLAPVSTEKPRYGGTVNILETGDIVAWDTAVTPTSETLGSFSNFDQWAYQDWGKGLAGTGEYDWGVASLDFAGYGPEVAESWEIIDANTWKFKIRRGIHWANPGTEAGRLVNGRELTVDDILWNQNRLMKTHRKTSGIGVRQPLLSDTVSWEKTGPWEFIIRVPEDPFTGWFWIVVATWGYHPPEVIQKYGDATNWRNRVGFGPYMVTDFVSDSLTTLVRNPNYWKKDPVGPGKGNQLPYIETVKRLVVPDLSTRLAAMRTAKADWVQAIEGEDARSLLNTNPQLKYYKYLGSTVLVAGRLDKLELPFKDKRVRHALMMATDMETLKNELYEGDAEILTWPMSPEQKTLYVPLEKLPDSIQALYRYNPAKAKQLLAEAGYPNGFKTKMIVQNISEHMDSAAAIKAMWAKVGVDVEIQPRERAVFTSISNGRSHEELVFRTSTNTFPASYPSMTNIRGPSMNNASYLDDPPGTDPFVEEVFQEIQRNVIVNFPKADQLYREKMVPYLLEQSPFIPRPTPYTYRLWQPWVKNYYGESTTMMVRYSWIDQDLKEKMTGRR